MGNSLISAWLRKRAQSKILALAFLCALCLALPAWAEKLVPVAPGQSAMPMLPHLEWLLDPTGSLTVEDLGQARQQAAFKPLKLTELPKEAGTLWLRFTLAARPAAVRPATLLLDMGEGVPDTPTLFVPKHNIVNNTMEWQTFTPSQGSVFLMPETRGEQVTAYIRLDGMPGMWFAPMLRTPHNAATAMERLARPAVIVALGVVMLLCLLRGLTERGEWRIWTSIYTGAALFHAVWGMPSTAKGHVDMLNLAAVLAPGVALMILPHVGRHLMRTRQLSRSMDIQYFLLSLPGAALALIPLLPGFSWTTRFLELWPVGTLLLVPTTLCAWLSGLPGARRFLLGCLLPPLGVAVGLLASGQTIPPPMLATAPLWGLALGALIIAGTAAPQEHSTLAATHSGPSPQSLLQDDPDLRIVPVDELIQGGTLGPAHAGPMVPGLNPGLPGAALVLEEKLRAPMDDLLRDGTALAQCSLPPSARQLTDTMLETVRNMATTLSSPLSPVTPAHTPTVAEEALPFDLQELLRQAHDSVSPVADSKNIALSWFMPPHLGQRYTGHVAQVRDVLQLLLESSVRATSRGAVQLSVRRVPESVNPGHLLFTVTDTGTGIPPQDRSSVALARAWELAGAHRCFLGVESGPLGATVSFTLRFEVAGAESTDEQRGEPGEAQALLPTVIVAEDSASERQLLVFFMEGLPLRTIEARSIDEAVDLYMDSPARLVIFDGDMPQETLSRAVQRIRTYEEAQGSVSAMIMGLSSDDSQWAALSEAGFTHAQPKPITRAGLRATLRELLPELPAEESLTEAQAAAPQASVLQDLPHLPLPLSLPDQAQPAALAQQAAENNADANEEIIDTGLPLLNMEPETAPQESPQAPATPDLQSQAPLSLHTSEPGSAFASEPSPAAEPTLLDSPLSMASPATPPTPVATAAPVLPHLLPPVPEEKAPAQESPAETAPVPDLFPSNEELTPPRHVAATPPPPRQEVLPQDTPLAKQTGLHPGMFEVSVEDQLLGGYSAPSLLAKKPEPQSPPRPAEPQPQSTDHEIAQATVAAAPAMEESDTAPPAASDGHAAYLTSLLDGGGDMVRSAASPAEAQAEPQADPLSTPRAPAPAQTPGQASTVHSTLKVHKVSRPSDRLTEPPTERLAENTTAPHSSEWVGEPQPIADKNALRPIPPTPRPISAIMEESTVGTEWVGEPMPIVRPVPEISLESEPEPKPEPKPESKPEPKPEPKPESKPEPKIELPKIKIQHTPARPAQPKAVAEEPFVPLSMAPTTASASTVAPAAAPAAETDDQRQGRPSLLPQSTPLMDFIIGGPDAAADIPEPTPAPMAQAQTDPQSAPPAAPQAPEPAPATQRTYGSVGEPTPIVKASAASTPKEASIPGSPEAPGVPDGPDEMPLTRLLDYFDQAVVHSRQCFEKNDSEGVHEGAAFIAKQADKVGLRTLARMSRCVADAAKASDLDAIRDLLPELESTVERNRIALGG